MQTEVAVGNKSKEAFRSTNKIPGRKKPTGARVDLEAEHQPTPAEPVLPRSAGESSKSRISSKGQLTLPLQVRQRLGVKAGDQVEFYFDGERTIVKPVRKEGNPFAKWLGIAKNVPADFDPVAYQREMRGWDEYDDENYG